MCVAEAPQGADGGATASTGTSPGSVRGGRPGQEEGVVALVAVEASTGDVQHGLCRWGRGGRGVAAPWCDCVCVCLCLCAFVCVPLCLHVSLCTQVSSRWLNVGFYNFNRCVICWFSIHI